MLKVADTADADADNLYHLTGCHHTSCGRVLPGHGSHLGELYRPPDPSFRPVQHLVEGANRYAQSKGFGVSHGRDFSTLHRTPESIETVGKAYDALPHHDPASEASFEAMRRGTHEQFHHLTHNLGVQVHVTDHDPYKHIGEMVHDLTHNNRLKVLGTHVTGGHPYFSNEENNKFRAVHDAFGHAATGRNFDRHGEEAAFQAHRGMFHPAAHGALASETRGQNSSLILNGRFGPQKVAALPNRFHTARKISRQEFEMRHQPVARLFHESGIVVVAHDSGDGETIYHCPFCGSGQVIARSDGTVECEFCHTAFTVQVQPEMSAFPQTINGVPVDVPGMPGEIGAEGEDPMDPGAETNAPPAGAPGSEPGAPPDGEEGPEDDPEGKEPPSDGPPKFSMLFKTASGTELDAQEYLNHLAVRFSHSPAHTAALIKQARYA